MGGGLAGSSHSLWRRTLCAGYGRSYWLDHLPHMSADDRPACLLKYKYKQTDVTKAVLKLYGSRPAPAPSIYPYLCAPPPLLAALHSLLLHEETIASPEARRPFYFYFCAPNGTCNILLALFVSVSTRSIGPRNSPCMN